MKDRTMPLVSVVIPVYNGQEYVAEAVSSVLQSDYDNFEIILVNDGSTDNSKKLCNDLASKHPNIRVFSFPKNRGMSHALNKGISHARGEYIARINQDDIMLSDRLSKQVAFLEDHPQHVAVGGATEWFDEKGKLVDRIVFPETDLDIKKHWLYFSPFADPVVMYRKSAFLKTSFYHQDFWPVDDVRMWYELGKLGKLANLPDVLTRIRWHRQAGSIKLHKLQVKRLFQLHLWARKHIASPSLFVWAFWLAQLAAGYIFPPQFNWWAFRNLRRLKY